MLHEFRSRRYLASDLESRLETGLGREAPGHRWGVVGHAESSVGAEQDDAAVSAEAIVQIRHCLTRGELRRAAGGYAIGGPLAEHQFHDGFAPASERHCSGHVVGIAAATNER